MNDIFNIIIKTLRSNSFYIPSKNSYVNGCSLTIKQYNELLELDTTTSFSFEQFLKFSILSDRIVVDNLESVDDLLYFDKQFILTQIKMAQEAEFLGLPLKEYQTSIKNKMETISLSSYEATYSNSNLKIGFGLNDFKTVAKINIDYLISLENQYKYPGEVISLEIFKYLKNIEYYDQNISEGKDIKDLKGLIGEMPANLVETFNSIMLKANKDTNEMNTFEIKGDKFVFNPTLEFMLS